MAPHEYGNRYGMSANVGGIGGLCDSAADAGICSRGGDTDVAERTDGVFEVSDGCEHWAVDGVSLASAGAAGLFLAVFAWGGVACPPFRRPMPCR